MASPSHVGLCTPDLGASVRFFADGLGFEVCERWELDASTFDDLPAALEVEPAPDGGLSVASQLMRNDGFAIELLAYGEPEPGGSPSASRGTVGLTHLAFWVDDLDVAVDRAVAAGGTVLQATRADLGVELVFLADPAGVRIELMQRPP